MLSPMSVPVEVRAHQRRGWFRLMAGSGLAMAAVMAGGAFAPFDREALGYTLLVLAAVALSWWRPKAGSFGLLALFGNALAWMVPAVLGNLEQSHSMSATLVPGVIAVAAAAGAVGAVGTLRGKDGRWGPPVVALVGLLALGPLVLVAGTSRTDPVPPADVEMQTRDMAFLPSEVDVRAGRLTVRVRNEDLFWHTFTVPELDLDVTIPARGERTDTFQAPPGSYEFVCAIPGHTQLGMRGTLEVGGPG